MFAMHNIALFFPIFKISRSNEEFERRVDGGLEGEMVTAEVEEEW